MAEIVSQAGVTALLTAAKNGHPAIVAELLDRGAEIEARTIVSELEWPALASRCQRLDLLCAHRGAVTVGVGVEG